jgi:U3 small nucleolar RNA-associated protein 4
LLLLLILYFANDPLELYDVEARQFLLWSRALCATLPKQFTHLHDAILGSTPARRKSDSFHYQPGSALCARHLQQYPD